jgi:FlaA1/EpsC-like NDP-sugar epimerase
MFTGKTLLITGGTGTFGNGVLRRKDAQLVIAGPDDGQLAEVQTLI